MMFQKEDLIRMMQQNVLILENFASEIATVTYMLQQKMELLSYKGIRQKAAFWLLMRAKQSGKSEVRIPDSVSKWAMLLNVSRPSLHRELKHLEESGIIDYTSHVVKILDLEALQEVLGN